MRERGLQLTVSPLSDPNTRKLFLQAKTKNFFAILDAPLDFAFLIILFRLWIRRIMRLTRLSFFGQRNEPGKIPGFGTRPHFPKIFFKIWNFAIEAGYASEASLDFETPRNE